MSDAAVPIPDFDVRSIEFNPGQVTVTYAEFGDEHPVVRKFTTLAVLGGDEEVEIAINDLIDSACQLIGAALAARKPTPEFRPPVGARVTPRSPL